MSFRKIFLLLFLSYSLSGLSLQDVKAADNEEISQKIDSIVAHQLPSGTDAAIVVYDLSNDTCIYGYRQNVLCRPASVMKILTSTTALSCLGQDYMFDTKLRITGTVDSDSTLHGNLYVVGGIDPSFMENDMRYMIQELKDAGINRIAGSVIGDVSAMDTTYWAPGWCWDDAPSSFQPYISPLMVHGGVVGVSVRPTETGEAPSVSIYPANSFVRVVNTAVTRDKSKGPLSITRDWLHNDNTIYVTGNCTKTQATDLSIVGTADFFMSLFMEYLESYGIKADHTDWGVCPSSAITVSVVSHSLKSVMREALKESNNLYAEAMFLQVGRLSRSKGVTFKDAADYESDFIRRTLGGRKMEYNIVDGCGLSMYDYVSPTLVVDMLRYIYKHDLLYRVLFDCLPVSGIDGTLKGRMGSSKTIKKIHAKTGSVTGSCTLAGYASASDGRMFAFCIMNEGAISMSPSRRVQDAICVVLCE